MNKLNSHLAKYRKKAHSTQKKSGHHLKMIIANMSALNQKKNARIKELERQNKELLEANHRLADIIEGKDGEGA